ncbi:D-sedoheptulose 7-phosphate isomerase [Hungatella effluvii]|uniref:D-sedoheptulose 7-phosphate isomerase n=1 Tax=Hungatella effluvii TaxID=1096246 RepID=A0A2V3Y428_9FIRM|nr:SIS domain-containing protein [Hungatella effluvii]PXX52411.1 D-sedoheptulose 7-phosphate isomerase [Hungatella effluvii]
MELYNRYPALRSCRFEIEETVSILEKALQKGGKLLLCGNGGSSADCDHIVGELMKGFLKKRPAAVPEAWKDNGEAVKLFAQLQGALPAISLSAQSAIVTAYANDADPDMVYAQLTYGYGRTGDVLVAVSTSGNSENVLNAVKTANFLGLKTVGLTGGIQSKMDSLCTITIKVPETETYRIQELHLPVYHYLCARLEEYFF